MAQQKSASAGIIATVLIVLVLAFGIYWFVIRGDKPTEANNMINPQTASQLSESFKGLSDQDRSFANVKTVTLVTDNTVEQAYSVVRPLEQLSASDQAKSKQTINGGTATTTQAFAISKRSGTQDDARSLYNSGYFVYNLEGAVAEQGTEAVVKAKAQAEISAYEKGNSDPDSPYTYSNGPVEKSEEVVIKTTKGEPVTLPVTKYKQTVASKSDATQKKEIIRVLAAAKLGTQLVLVNMVVDDSKEFGNESQLLQAMANYVQLEVM